MQFAALISSKKAMGFHNESKEERKETKKEIIGTGYYAAFFLSDTFRFNTTLGNERDDVVGVLGWNIFPPSPY